jgi:uncharacterized protein (TIRG00374 family)
LSSLRQLQKYFEGRNLIIPVAIGLAVVVYFFYKDFNPEAYQEINWGVNVLFWSILALIMVAFRFLGYVYRLRILSDNKLSWRKCFHLIVLWEFSSAISPGIIGGTAAAFILLAQEKKLGTGKSTAIVLATSYLDVLFYVLAVPALLVFTGLNSQIPDQIGVFGGNLMRGYFIAAYCILFIWAIVVYIGIFIKPQVVSAITKGLFKLPLLRRWKENAQVWGDEMLVAAEEFKLKKRKFWYKAFGATLFSWVSRFALVNFLILAFGNGSEVLEIFARQLIMWGALMLPVTPGASGLAELLFPAFLGEYFTNVQLANTTSVLWRLISYFPYLILGIVVFPIWIRGIIKEHRRSK